jgi:hypothetical protein
MLSYLHVLVRLCASERVRALVVQMVGLPPLVERLEAMETAIQTQVRRCRRSYCTPSSAGR